MNEVIVVDYDPQWPALFAQEAEAIRQAVGLALAYVEHVGSTSIPGLASKSVIDILAGVTSLAASAQAVPALEALGYEYRGENGIPGRLYFCKGRVRYQRTHHLHMVETGHEQWMTMLSFRDYLRAHPDEARRYEALKRGLAVRFQEDRRAYTEGKEECIRVILEKAHGTGAMEPVEVVDYHSEWPQLFLAETAGLRQAFGVTLIMLEHIGSTAVPGLAAKPVIDIQAVVQSISEAQKAVPALAALGWEKGIFARDPERRLFFKKFHQNGALSHHLHVYEAGHSAAADHTLFRDILRRHPDEAKRYLDLKNDLAHRYQHDRIAYSHAKTEYVEAVLAKARGG